MGTECVYANPQQSGRIGIALGPQCRHIKAGELPDFPCPSCKQVGVVALCEECGTRLIQMSETEWMCGKCATVN